MTDSRVPRGFKTREQTARPTSWRPPDLLPTPDPQPGFVYRWVRVSSFNELDGRNLSSRLREGWEPVTIEEQPKFKMLADPHSRYEGSIEIGGLLLCKAPKEIIDQRNEYYGAKAKSAMEAVDNNFMSQNDPRMPLFMDRKSNHSFGSGV